MWKITTRGFTLQEVLILVAMNLEPTLTTFKPEQRSRDKEEAMHGTKTLI
jgi:hypothetical protein